MRVSVRILYRWAQGSLIDGRLNRDRLIICNHGGCKSRKHLVWIGNPEVAHVCGDERSNRETNHVERAPARVWKALTNAEEFGNWFGVKLDGPFEAGGRIAGRHRSNQGRCRDSQGSAALCRKTVRDYGRTNRVPERLFSFRWHPFAVEPDVDYSERAERTLIEFTLEEKPHGVMLTVTESGFDRIPLERRAKAFTANEELRTMVVTLIEKYLAQNG